MRNEHADATAGGCDVQIGRDYPAPCCDLVAARQRNLQLMDAAYRGASRAFLCTVPRHAREEICRERGLQLPPPGRSTGHKKGGAGGREDLVSSASITRLAEVPHAASSRLPDSVRSALIRGEEMLGWAKRAGPAIRDEMHHRRDGMTRRLSGQSGECHDGGGGGENMDDPSLRTQLDTGGGNALSGSQIRQTYTVRSIRQKLGDVVFGELKSISGRFQRGEISAADYSSSALRLLDNDEQALNFLVNRLPDDKLRRDFEQYWIYHRSVSSR